MKRIRKKGFTLIELLAVIVILAIIALIATPIIVDVINDAKKNAFKDTAYGIIEAGKLYYAGEFGNDSFSGKTFDFTGNIDELKLSGEKPAGGTLVVSQDGKYGLAIYNKEKSFCAIKEYDKEDIKVITYKEEDCKVSQLLMGAAKTITDKNTSGNSEGLFTDDFGNIRYRGASPKNYVTFNNEVWRIIGVFNGKLKLIREERINNTEDVSHPNEFLWDKNGQNDWSTASAQTYLNTTYYNSLDVISKNMIVEEKYNLGGITTADIDKKTAYEKERGTIVYIGRPTEWTGRIGLMYLSDYGYAAGEDCTKTFYYYDNTICKNSNWLYKSGDAQWAMTPRSNESYDAARVYGNGNANLSYVSFGWYSLHPVLYLNSSVQITAGDGTSSNPYILK